MSERIDGIRKETKFSFGRKAMGLIKQYVKQLVILTGTKAYPMMATNISRKIYYISIFIST